MSTLYEQLGGQAAISDAVDIFYEKVLSDDLISPFFYYTDMAEQFKKQELFLSMVFGGPVNYSTENLRKIHAPLIKKGLNEEHFNAVASYLKLTLEEMNVPDNLISEAMDIVASTKNDILNL